ncbi:amino acid adenylation domain-containing protein [Jatrophihabitans sp.]|uniref:amino acid adenylation domain-containing protein n=1 Tax=Jatrophihabitans sp. TaxID=1932789 RepID=UPI002B7C99AA|nr:amino acid adenylation domain-containing protein [Jatrophihabitans sp.]
MSTASRPLSNPESSPEPVELVADRPRTAAGSSGLAWLSAPADGHGPDAVLAAFAVLLYKYTGQTELLLDAELAGRAGALSLTVDPDAPGHRLPDTAGYGPVRHTPVRFTDRAPDQAADADLVLHAGTELRIGYRTGLFASATAARLAEQLRRALAQLHQPVRTVQLADQPERALILDRFNDTRRPYPADVPVHRLFEEQVRRAPDALAVSWCDQRLSYAQLDERADRLAGALRAAGVRPGDLVALRTGRTPDLVAGVLAILKTGAAYLPIDPDYPQGRVEFLLADSRARVLVTDSALDAAFDGTVLDPATAARAAGPVEPEPVAPDLPTDRAVAFLCYTSGTTGRPKGVRVTHRNIVRLVRGVEYSDLGPHTRILLTGSISFDASTFELWATLLNGGSLHLVGNDVLFSARALRAELAAEQISTLWLTAPLFNQIVEQDPAAFAPLRELYTGGDVLSPPHVAKVLAACPDLILINAYGPTENGTYSLTHRIERAGFDERAGIPIGRPIANSTAYVLDPDGNLCPVGVPGELCFGGDGVAAGYLDRPELTPEKFVADPFTGGRMYRSGDLGRFGPDGTVEFLGRRDQQVKVRGFRIELGEVENVLLGHPDVAEAAVTARPRPSGADKYLCGYYVPRRPVTGLRAYLERMLPAHAVPAYLIELPELPLHASGKLDRSRLPEPEASQLVTGTDYVAPRDEFERVLVELAENALAMVGIGMQHDLRDLGSDSLTATLLAGGLAERLGRQVPVSRVLHAGSLARLAELVRHGDAAAAPAIPAAAAAESYPVTPQQRQLYLEQLKDPAAVHYNVPVSLDLPAGTDPARLAGALRRLAEHHEALRSHFVLDGGEVRQRIEPEIALPVPVIDEPADSPGVRPFALEVAPLWRAELRRSPDRLRLRLELHHLIVDGFSLQILLSDLAALYAGRPVAEVGVRYRDYASWLAGPAGAALREQQRGYWQQVFAVPPRRADLPLSAPRPPLRPLAGDVLGFDLGRARTSALRELARRQDVPLFAVLAAAHGIVLARLTGSADVLLGTPVSGRTAPGLHRTVGMLANTVCLRLAADPEAGFADYLRQVAGTAEQAFAHSDVPFSDVVALAAPQRDYRRAPLFDALIALHSSRYLHLDFAGHGVDVTLEPTGQSAFDLNMQIYQTGDSLRVAWHYSATLLRRTEIEQWRDDLLHILDTVLADPATPVGAFTAPANTAAAFDFDL